MIASISSVADFERIKSSITDRWGNVPPPILGLSKVSLLKNMAEKSGAERVSITHKKAVLNIALDYKNFADLMCEKVSKNPDWRVYKKDNWAIFERVSPHGSWEENFDAVLKILS